LDKGYAPSVVKFLFLQSHYSSELDINVKGLQDAEKGLKRLMDALSQISNFKFQFSDSGKTKLDEEIEKLSIGCKEFMDDDFNTAKTIANLFELSSIINSLKGGQIKTEEISKSSIELMQKTLHDYLFDVFGLKNENTNAGNNKLDEALQVLINLRKEAKAKKDFATSDLIRNQLAEKGIQLKDEKDGSMSWSMI
jgi:cysteinyl-tRNA synthetase